MSTECVNVADGSWSATVTEEHGKGVNAFLVVVVEVPELLKGLDGNATIRGQCTYHRRVRQVCLWVSLV